MMKILLKLNLKKRYSRPHIKMMKVYISEPRGILEVGLIKEDELRGEDQQIREDRKDEDSKDLMRKEDRIDQ